MAQIEGRPTTPTGRMLVAVEAVPEANSVIAAAVQMARRSHAEVVVLSVRERDSSRGLAWDRRPVGELAEVISQAIHQFQRVGVEAHGIIRVARCGRVADEIVYTADRHGADEIVIGSRRRSWLGALLRGSVSSRVLMLSPVPVVAVPAASRPVTAHSRLASAFSVYRSGTVPKR